MQYRPNYDNYKKFRRRRRRVVGPIITGGLAIILVAAGLTLIYFWIKELGIELAFLHTATPSLVPSPTEPPIPDTPTITLTPSETPTPSITPTQTASAPFIYSVQSGDTLVTIAELFEVDYLTIMALNGLTNDSILFIGDELIIPHPGMEFPTPTPLPPNLRRGFEIEYFVLPGDSIKTIAEKFLSTVEDIIAANELEDPNAIFPGQILKVPYRMITPTFGPSPTPEGVTTTETPTSTQAGTTATATPNPTTNP
jgi:LysM repeat protein